MQGGHGHIDPSGFRGSERTGSGWLTENGFDVGELTYHRHLDPKVVQTLTRRVSPTALTIRTRADRIAVHRTLPVEFLVELKTGSSRSYSNWAIELLPLAHHLCDAAMFSVQSLYAYVDASRHVQPGFWCTEPPPVSVVRIPCRWQDTDQDRFAVLANTWLPNVRVIRDAPWEFGSGDPYVLIDADGVGSCSDWRDLVLQAIEQAEKTQRG